MTNLFGDDQMAKIKLTKTAVDAATPKDRDYELRDTIAPGSC